LNEIKVIVNYSDSTNYDYVKLTPNGIFTDVELYNFVGGVDDRTAWGTTNYTTGQWIPIKVCVADNIITVNSYPLYLEGPSSTQIPSVALGTGTATEVLFDTFVLSRKIKDDCPYCLPGCNKCEDADAPDCISVTFDGFAALDPPQCYAVDAACLNATFYLAWGGGQSCVWYNGIPVCYPSCDLGPISASIIKPADNYILQLSLSHAGPTPEEYIFEADLGTDNPNCQSWSDLALTFISSTGATLDTSGVSATVSAEDGEENCEQEIVHCGSFTNCGFDSPDTITLTVAGVYNWHHEHCDNHCDDINRTYTLERSQSCCVWESSWFDPAYCYVRKVTLAVSGSPSTTTITIKLMNGYGGMYYAAEEIESWPITCEQLDGLVFDDMRKWGMSVYACDVASADATVDANCGVALLSTDETQATITTEPKPRRKRKPCGCGGSNRKLRRSPSRPRRRLVNKSSDILL
jgi:hypothetical protein